MNPTARAKTDFAMEMIGDQMVVFDPKRMAYHHLNAVALQIWQASDGTRSRADLAQIVYGDVSASSIHMVGIGLEALETVGLIESGGVSRRSALRLGVSVVLGAGLVPVVTSISVPVSAQGQTPTPLPQVIPEWNGCYSDFRTGACVAGACCCYNETVDIKGVCRADGGCPYQCV